ncbi:metalloregulator ArsR/SmtB family transcription factor [Gracilibacillus sp. S3-1-1]|uniref:Metalloregulator ArsR/SmtB family transcription factor n=1 Tax=Gracilibacillus pellucidus TaxID=3095368 RepID=A0ACC6M8A2_9BACI|nr:metalloregulator ArsR/SmtB family transcription factor [Gracilibacillus sp. S3-1-1]MDX8047174.1 metalloregulator ArsR/SmtB family transcription factor [Gracilibacillus sp. S3-1-1]
MQLSKIVHFHKTIGDKTRIRIIYLLKSGPLHGQAIAGKLGLKPPTISHHLAKLKEIDVVTQRRDKNTIYFYLNEEKLKRMAEAITKIGGINLDNELIVSEEEKAKVIQNFIDSTGRLKTIPAQRKKKNILLEYMVRGLEQGKQYKEEEINEHILRYHEDYATIRREFVMTQFMYRQDGVYELNPKEMWPV